MEEIAHLLTFFFFLYTQAVPVVKNLTANAGDVRDVGLILGQAHPLKEGTPTRSSILAWRIPMQRGAWGAAAHRVAKSQTQLKCPSTAQHSFLAALGLCC